MRCREALAGAVEARGPLELAVCWIHTDAPEAPAIVADALAPGARLVQVFGTRVWPLADVPLHVAYRQVLLGAVGGRWLTHEEIPRACSRRSTPTSPAGSWASGSRQLDPSTRARGTILA